MRGVLVLRLETQGTRLNETIHGGSYTGQRYSWLLFPQRGGATEIPALDLNVQIKRFGATSGDAMITATAPAVTLATQWPPGTGEDTSGLISASRLAATQAWEPSPNTSEVEVAVGDAITRTITLEAADLPGMAFAPLHFDPIEGLGVYPGQPRVADRVDRGTLEGGQRMESVTYVAEQSGGYNLPPIEIVWWDLPARQLRRQILEGLKLSVTAVAEDAGAEAAVAGRWWWWSGILTALVAATVAWLLRERITGLWRGYRARP